MHRNSLWIAPGPGADAENTPETHKRQRCRAATLAMRLGRARATRALTVIGDALMAPRSGAVKIAVRREGAPAKKRQLQCSRAGRAATAAACRSSTCTLVLRAENSIYLTSKLREVGSRVRSGGQTVALSRTRYRNTRWILVNDLFKIHPPLQHNQEVRQGNFSHNPRAPQILQFALRASPSGHSVWERHHSSAQSKIGV